MLGRLGSAKLDIEAAATLDPGNPQWRVQRSAVEFMAGNHEAAIAVVWEKPPAALLQRLPQHFADLEQMLRARNDPIAERYAAERSFAEGLLALQHSRQLNAVQLARANMLAKAAMLDFQRAGLLYKDARPWLLTALQALDVDNRAFAEQCAQEVRKAGLEVHPWQRELIGEAGLAKLRSVGSWAELLK
jgi:hypothetical protein